MSSLRLNDMRDGNGSSPTASRVKVSYALTDASSIVIGTLAVDAAPRFDGRVRGRDRVAGTHAKGDGVPVSIWRRGCVSLLVVLVACLCTEREVMGTRRALKRLGKDLPPTRTSAIEMLILFLIHGIDRNVKMPLLAIGVLVARLALGAMAAWATLKGLAGGTFVDDHEAQGLMVEDFPRGIYGSEVVAYSAGSTGTAGVGDCEGHVSSPISPLYVLVRLRTHT